jgi:hypothetical protein
MDNGRRSCRLPDPGRLVPAVPPPHRRLVCDARDSLVPETPRWPILNDSNGNKESCPTFSTVPLTCRRLRHWVPRYPTSPSHPHWTTRKMIVVTGRLSFPCRARSLTNNPRACALHPHPPVRCTWEEPGPHSTIGSSPGKDKPKNPNPTPPLSCGWKIPIWHDLPKVR